MDSIRALRNRVLFRDRRLPIFSYHVRRGVLVIIDKDDVISVTNRAKDVLEQIYIENPGFAALRVIYRDTMGMYDGMELIDGQFIGFHPLQEVNEDAAISKLAVILRQEEK